MGQRALFVIKFSSDNGTVEVDSCLDETHQLINAITDHPVEQGFNVTDHSRPEPDRVTLRCFVSNTPFSREQVERSIRQGNIEFTTSAAQSASKVLGIDGRGQATFNQLERMRVNGELLKVVTTLRTYAKSDSEGMMIESLTIPRTRQNYDGLEWTMTLKRVRIVKNRSTTQKNADKRTRKKKKQGQKLTEKDHGPEERKKTALLKTAQGVGIAR
jgi:hypothetical protein